MRRWGLVAAATLLASGCAGTVIPRSASSPPPVVTSETERPATQQARIVPAKPVAPTPVASAPGTTARTSGVIAASGVPPIDDAQARRALTAFRISCPALLLKRADQSGLTRPGDWAAACNAAKSTRPEDARSFFLTQFEPVQVGDGKAFATGYYEPEIEGSRTRDAAHQVPVYGVPKDLVSVDLGEFTERLKGRSVTGRIVGGDFVPYHDRAAIEQGALAGRGLEIAWAADPVEFFFLQVQGSGRLRQPNGQVIRIGYAGQNGRDYTGIGKLMKDRGLLGPGQTTMQGLIAYIRANPAEGTAIMRENKSWVFFRELTGPGPLGALNVPVTPRASVAADVMFVPLGAPVILSMDRADATGLWIAQDTGGAIKGSNRFDTFWGAGDEARLIAGGMASRGTAFLLLPKGTLARLAAEPTP
jgi:membrane-bound lytic murein transglycosylase A